MPAKFFSLSKFALIAANLIPLVGVLFYGWSSTLVLALFWIENLIVGLFNVLKMLVLVLRSKRFNGLATSAFFTFHYGFFCTVHGTILWDILNLGKLDVKAVFPNLGPGLMEIFASGMVVLLGFIDMFGAVIMLGIGALLLSHLVSFIEDFILKGEIFKETPKGLMSKPYRRIVVLHVGLILGALALEKLGSPVWLLVAVVVFKIVMDLVWHARQHKGADGKTQVVKDL